jgi:hypothetical protein
MMNQGKSVIFKALELHGPVFRWGCFWMMALGLAGCELGGVPVGNGQAGAAAVRLTPEQVERVGRRIWQNECAGTVEGLTSWNVGEDFASLGIGHFIWYPEGKRGPFEESFPRLMRYFHSRGVPVSDWMRGACPWRDRASFLADQNGGRQRELRKLLSGTVRLQTEFIMMRSRSALPKMMAASQGQGERVKRNYELLSMTPEGTFALIDYVNFKGEGTAATERYRGVGWGLLQVLEGMANVDAGRAPLAFADAASAVLTRRVQNAPPERGEGRWLAGWKARCEGYKRPL